MRNVVPIRRPDSELFRSYRNTPPSRELSFRLGFVVIVVLFLSAFVSVFGAMFLGLFGATTISAVGIGSTIHFRFPYQVQSCVPLSEPLGTSRANVVPKAA